MYALDVNARNDLFYPRSPPEICGFIGNSDAYGLGFRIGVYLQWFSTFVTVRFSTASSSECRTINSIFSFAVFIAVLVLTIQSPDSTYGVEILILLYILSGNGAINSVTNGRSKTLRYSRFRSFVGMLFGLAVMAYSLWFWFVGLDTFQRVSCETSSFLFSRVDLYGRARTFYKVMAIAFTVIISYATFYSSWDHIKSLCRGLSLHDLSKWPTIILIDIKVELEDAFLVYEITREAQDSEPIRWFTPGYRSDGYRSIIFCAATAYIILAIELTLFWNSVSGVYNVSSTGQLIPLAIGLLSFLRVVLNLIRKTHNIGSAAPLNADPRNQPSVNVQELRTIEGG